MRFGIGMYSTQAPPGSARSHHELFSDVVREAKLAEEVGLESIWLAEHHFTDDGYVGAVLPVCAAILASTSRLVAGTSVAVASFYNPVRLAEDAIALDLLSGGRFVLGLGTAYRPEEFAGMGIEPETDEARLDEVAAILPKAFSGRPFSHHGRFYEIPEVTVTPPPYTPGGPPLMLAGDGVIDRDAIRAAEAGKTYMIDPSLPLEEVTRLVELYDAHFSGAAGGELPIFNYGFLAEGTDPWAEMQAGFTYLRQTYDLWSGRSVQPVERANHRLILGDRQQVTDMILDYRRRFGDRVHFILRLNYPGQDPVSSERAIRLFGDVAERVRQTSGPEGG